VIVEMDQNIFKHPDSLSLLALLHLGWEGRHIFTTSPAFDTSIDSDPINQWLNSLQNPELTEALSQVLNDGTRNGTSLAPRIHISSQAQTGSQTPTLSLSEALKLLRTPVKVLLENINSDRVFLEKILPKSTRDRYSAALQNGWLELFHGGGLDPMETWVKTIRQASVGGTRCSSLLWWTLFDSDEGGQPQRSLSFEQVCQRNGVSYHRLSRREAENYLPLELLARWSERSESQLQERKKRFRMLKNMPPADRYIADMKEALADNGILSMLGDSSISESQMDAWLDRECHDERMKIAASLREVL
jgi:hypothetical protein